VTSLITVRYPNDTSVDDLLWPAVTPGLLIRLEPGEVLRWRGRAHVAEDRYAEPQVLHADYERVWNLLGPADCLITDRRITYRGDRGNTLQWSGGMSAAVAPSLREPRGDSHWGMPMGQVRFQWPLNVVVQRQVQAAVIGVTCINGGMPLRITLTMIDTQTSRAWLGDVAGDVASGLARDIARFRLLAQAGQLTPEEVRQLTLLRDGPMLAVGGSSLGWELPGGLPVGQAATPGLAPVVPARPTVPDGFRAAVEAFSAARSPQELGRAVEQHPVLLSEDIDAVLVGQLDWLRSRHSVDLVRQLTTWHEALRDWRKPGVSLDTTHDPYKEWRNKRDQEAWRNKRKQEASLPVVVKPVAPVVEDGAAARAVDQALALLAGVVGDRCRAEERAHGLQDPWPLPVRWMRSTLPVADQQPAILDEPSSDRTVGRSGQLRSFSE
jgi:hypothetical protein